MQELFLEDICDVLSSKRIFAKDYLSSGIPFFRGKEVTEWFLRKPITPEFFISESLFNQIKSKYGAPVNGDILITAVGTLGSLMFVGDENFYFKDGNVIWLRNFSSCCTSKYIFYYLCSNKHRGELLNSAIGSTQKALTIEMVKRLPIQLPNINEQRHIVNIAR